MKTSSLSQREQPMPQSSLIKTFISLLVVFYRKHTVLIFFLLLLCMHLLLRCYQLFGRAEFNWDQVDSAWAAKHILVDKQFFLDGPVAKGNSGIHMGPLYFYAIAVFYFFTNLDPIASPLFQTLLTVINLGVLFWITKKLFGTKTAFIAGSINTSKTHDVLQRS